MRANATVRAVLVALLLCIPFALAFLSWKYFPAFAEWVVVNVLHGEKTGNPSNIFWYTTVKIFYTWYTFLAIGVGGAWVLAAALSRRKRASPGKMFYPLVSFIVPAYNQEKNVARCIRSLTACAREYKGLCEVIVVDDGSSDQTYEAAWSTLMSECRSRIKLRGRVLRHSVNLGKTQALRSGVLKALGSLVAIVDADSEWAPATLQKLVDYKLLHREKAVTGYVHPAADNSKDGFLVKLQQLEYSQGLSVGRCAQALTNSVLVVPGAIGLYDVDVLREVLTEKPIKSVTEDFEVTLEMHSRNAKVGYDSEAFCITRAPASLKPFWKQRMRWFSGWLHNTFRLHRKVLSKGSAPSMLLWYSAIFEYVGAFVDLAALSAFPFLFWFAPSRLNFALALMVFVPYSFLVGLMFQAVALNFAYGKLSYGKLLLYTPAYPFLRLINVLARAQCTVNYIRGNNGKWH
jgi:cellulose synthase/poly-beta-1,6-N-acetylglucosamine synthase-like glycosyltransferase